MFTNLHKYALRGCLLMALLVAACAPSVVETPTPEPVTLKVLRLPYLSFSPLFIADEEGGFAEQGLQVEFVELRGMQEAVAALAQEELDVAAGLITVNMLNAIAQGSNIKFVADKAYVAPTGCADNAFMARRALVEAGELDSPAQLQGRRISIDRTSAEGYIVAELLSMGGLTFDDVEIEDLPTPAELEALGSGSLDMVSSSEPWTTRISQSGHGVLWMPVREVVPDFQFAIIVFGPSLLDESTDAGNRFMTAYLKAVQQYNQGKTERNLEILLEHTGLDKELLEQACWPHFREDGRINVQSVLDFQHWAVEQGYLDSPVTEEQFWDPSFVEYANEVLGSAIQ